MRAEHPVKGIERVLVHTIGPSHIMRTKFSKDCRDLFSLPYNNLTRGRGLVMDSAERENLWGTTNYNRNKNIDQGTRPKNHRLAIRSLDTST
jgi:hypothetical protein